jgi:hypothetical protein
VTVSRKLWRLYEPLHAITYFSPHSTAAGKAHGLRGFWMTYFAFRAAPFGPIGPAPVTASFFGFHPDFVARALPAAWQHISPEQAIAAREAAIAPALNDILGPVGDELDCAEAADLAWHTALLADTAGRPVAATNQTLPPSGDPRIRLWQACTVLREHRGDGHVATLVTREIRPAEAHLIKIGAGESDAENLKSFRGFPDEEWSSAQTQLRDRGLTDEQGLLTAAGRAEHDAIEEATDAAAEQPWRALGDSGTRRLVELLTPLTKRVLAAGLIPRSNPVGLVWDQPDP